MLGPTCAKRSRYLNSVNKVKGCERAASNPGFYGRTQVVTAGGGHASSPDDRARKRGHSPAAKIKPGQWVLVGAFWDEDELWLGKTVALNGRSARVQGPAR